MHKSTVLIIDDEPVIIIAGKRTLGRAGFTVLGAESAEEGLELFRSQSIPVVVCDLILTGMSGLKFLSLALEHNPRAAVIVTTGYSTADHAITSLQEGAFDYLPKPFTLNELRSPVIRAARSMGLSPGRPQESGQTHKADTYYFGPNTWARLDTDGSALLGFSELLLATVEPISGIQLPEIDSTLHQGDAMVRLTTTDGLAHRVWAGLSGRVIETNPLVTDNPDSPRRDPLTEGWLVRIEPTNHEEELSRLRTK